MPVESTKITLVEHRRLKVITVYKEFRTWINALEPRMKMKEQ